MIILHVVALAGANAAIQEINQRTGKHTVEQDHCATTKSGGRGRFNTAGGGRLHDAGRLPMHYTWLLRELAGCWPGQGVEHVK